VTTSLTVLRYQTLVAPVKERPVTNPPDGQSYRCAGGTALTVDVGYKYLNKAILQLLSK